MSEIKSSMTDLEWLARNVDKVPNGMRVMRRVAQATVFSDDPHKRCWSGWFTVAEWQAERERLQNKPSWSDAPDWARWRAQDSSGIWGWHDAKPDPDHRLWVCMGEKADFAGESEVLGDWRDTLEYRPEPERQHPAAAVALVPELNSTQFKPGIERHPEDDLPNKLSPVPMHELYPNYYMDCRHLDSIDVYGVHDLFGVKDESGCLQHAGKKILLSGQRNGGKSLYQDIKEARDTLTRKLQLMEQNNEAS